MTVFYHDCSTMSRGFRAKFAQLWYIGSMATAGGKGGNRIEAITRRVRTARREQGLNQKEIADLLGLTRSGYGHYESGRQVPTGLKPGVPWRNFYGFRSRNRRPISDNAPKRKGASNDAHLRTKRSYLSAPPACCRIASTSERRTRRAFCGLGSAGSGYAANDPRAM